MTRFRVGVNVIRSYSFVLEAEDEQEAEAKALAMFPEIDGQVRPREDVGEPWEDVDVLSLAEVEEPTHDR